MGQLSSYVCWFLHLTFLYGLCMDFVNFKFTSQQFIYSGRYCHQASLTKPTCPELGAIKIFLKKLLDFFV